MSGFIDFIKSVIAVRKNSTGSEFRRRRLNFIEGSNVTLTVADDPTDDEIDVTIAAASGSSGGNAIYSDGTDGSFTLDGASAVAGCTIVTGNYRADRDLYFNEITVNSAIALNMNGFILHALKVTGVDATSVIHADGTKAAGATAGTTLGSNRTLGIGNSGGNGNTGAGNAGSNSSPSVGGAGAAGGASGSAGAAGGTVTAPAVNEGGLNVGRQWFGFTTGWRHGTAGFALILGGAGGGSGRGDGSNNAGGGGCGGNIGIFLIKTLAGTGTLRAAGGVGGAAVGGNSGGGGGGGGGGAMCVSNGALPGTWTLSAPGGVGGAHAGTGSDGSTGSTGNVYYINNA